MFTVSHSLGILCGCSATQLLLYTKLAHSLFSLSHVTVLNTLRNDRKMFSMQNVGLPLLALDFHFCYQSLTVCGDGSKLVLNVLICLALTSLFTLTFGVCRFVV